MITSSARWVARILTNPFIVWLFPPALFVFALASNSWLMLNWLYSAPYHFMGGVAMAMLYVYFWERHPELYGFKKSAWVNIAMCVGFVAMIGVWWEFYEYAMDAFAPLIPILHPAISNFGLIDTLSDLFFDMFGAAALFVVYRRSSLYKAPDATE